MPRCSRTPGKPWRRPWRASAASDRAARHQPCSQILATDVIYAPSGPPASRCPADAPTDAPIYVHHTAAPSGIPSIAADQRELHAVGPRSAASPFTTRTPIRIRSELFIQNLWNLLAAHRDGQRRRQYARDLHADCHNTVNAANASPGACGSARFDRRRHRPSTRPSSPHTSNVLFPHDEQALNMGVLQDL